MVSPMQAVDAILALESCKGAVGAREPEDLGPDIRHVKLWPEVGGEVPLTPAMNPESPILLN